MGGDTFHSSASSSDEESLFGPGSAAHESVHSAVSRDEDRLSRELVNDFLIIGDGGSIDGESSVQQVRRHSSISEAVERQKVKMYADVLRSYEEFEPGIGLLEEAKSKILSYRPGLWAEREGRMDQNELVVPPITSLLLIGPERSGKSSLVNKISRVLEDDVFALRRAQVSHNSSTTRGTYFLHEYTIPRGSGTFCLYDTRSLSTDSSENTKMLKRWMTKGVRHGELIKRKSDNADLKGLLKYKDQANTPSIQFKAVNFVIFVVNGLSVLESMDGDDEKKKQYLQIIATNFNNPLLSFKDDKPVVVVTHGDLLARSDCVRIRVYLGDLLGIPPTVQIFDIPENDDVATKLAVFDMLMHCLEHADKNLPIKNHPVRKVPSVVREFLIFWVVVLLIAIGFQVPNSLYPHLARAPITPPPPPPPPHRWPLPLVKVAQSTSVPPVKVGSPTPSVKVGSKGRARRQASKVKVDWHKIRHLWLEEDEPKVDWHKIRHAWLGE